MKKNVLIMMPYINCGGVETTLISLLNKLDKNIINVDLLIINNDNIFLDKIPQFVNIHYLTIPRSEWGVFYGYRFSIKKMLKQLDFFNLLKLIKRRNVKLTENRKENVKYFHYLNNILPIYEKEYDLAIDYFGYATFTTYYVAKKVIAKKKISWIHSRLSLIDANYLQEYYDLYDQIFAVSKSALKDFLSCVNYDKNKCKVFYNFIDTNRIKSLANQEVKDMDKGMIKLCTVGRLEEVKGYDLAVSIAKKLRDKGINFCWYFVGEGSLRNQLEEYICENNLKNNIILLGLKSNPYPYIKNCDIYIQPSRYEGYCTTTNEARVLAKPVITTNVFGADEQFASGKNGIIVGIDEDELMNAIIELIDDTDKRRIFSNELRKINFDYNYQLDMFKNL